MVSIDGSNVGVALPYGVEGFCQAKHLKREDGTDIKQEESADFIVLEFNRNAKRITVSHLRTYEEPPAKKRGGSDNRKRRDDRDGGSSPATQRAVREVNERQAKTTFGDLDVLSQLKQQMEDGLAAELCRGSARRRPRRPRSPLRRPPRPRRSRRPRRRRRPQRSPRLRKPQPGGARRGAQGRGSRSRGGTRRGPKAEEAAAEEAPAEEPKAEEGDADANEEENDLLQNNLGKREATAPPFFVLDYFCNRPWAQSTF